MFEMIKKGLLTGLGLAVVTKVKLEAALAKLVDDGKLSRAEAEKLLDELLQSGEKQWTELEEKIGKVVKDLIAGMDLCRRQELQELQGKLQALEVRLADLEKGATSASSRV
jgi:polyhydroxyalkanoate synthesis regulator phasin